ncbi:hypothetical protein H0H93_010223 [Arthromyces matolae]|nr:hypothetical protein H0H93_010223 [Arthromyces matolae]
MFHVPPSWASARSLTTRTRIVTTQLTATRLLTHRYLSTPVPTPKHLPPDPQVPPAPPAKHKLDLRPAPIKPQKPPTLSATHISSKLREPLPKISSQSTASLRAAEETSQRDIVDVETHGVLKPPPPGANWFRSTLHKAIQIAKFYYNGVKLIMIRRKEINLIHARIKAGGGPLTRFEFRLIQTQRSDLNKVVPFLFIALLLEEIIPLIAIYAPFMLPSTCILPSQRERIDAKRADKATAFSLQYRNVFSTLKQAESPEGHISLSALTSSGASVAVCGVLRLSTSGIDALRIRRIRNHFEFIAEDDRLLLQDDLINQLSTKELEEILGERGM